MAIPAFAVALPRNAKSLSLSLADKPHAPLSVTLITSPNSNILVTCINGLGLPQLVWRPVITQLISKHSSSGQPCPSFLTYDRYGQGETTSKDPEDENKEEGYGHDLAVVTKDFSNLLDMVCRDELHKSLDELEIVLVSNSIGCSISRYYAETHPGVVSALVLLDSTLTNSDFVDLHPDPESPDFDESQLPGSLTKQDIITARKNVGAIFHPSNKNKESFDRRNIREYLPYADQPKLKGKRGGPLITVMGHDWDFFADDSAAKLEIARDTVVHYHNPFWHNYNKGLVQTTDEGKGKGPIIAEGAGHFIQRDRPDLVSNEIWGILERLRRETSS